MSRLPTHRTLPTACGACRALVVIWFLLVAAAAAAAADKFYDRQPFDLITLKTNSERKSFKVYPLDLPDRRVPENPKPGAAIVVRLFEKPDTTYEIRWRSIEKVELFNQLILKEANKLIHSGRLDEAYDYFDVLLEDDPTLPGLAESIDVYLYEEAKALHRTGDFVSALAMLREIHDRNPERTEVEKALGVTTDKLVQAYVVSEQFESARVLIRDLKSRFEEHATVAKWENAWTAEASKLLADGKDALREERLHEANLAGRRMVLIWPALDGARQFMKTLDERYPRVVVGVSRVATQYRANAIDDWASRRTTRLIERTLIEFDGPGPEGGKYSCPFGRCAVRELGTQVAFDLKSGIRWSGENTTMSGFHLARRLLELTDPGHADYRVEWAELLSGVKVEDVYSVRADLRRPYLRPQSLLQIVIRPGATWSEDDASTGTSGPYFVESQSEKTAVYQANSRYFAAGKYQPKEILERRFTKGSDAVWALIHRQIDLLDRVNPWDLDRLREEEGMVVYPYAIPRLHCLIPNMRKPLLLRHTFRRALIYGIHREAILRGLLGGETLDGCEVVSGPFLPGVSLDDPISYAYDSSIEPRPYRPHLATALAQVALSEFIKIEKIKGNKVESMPELVIGYPPHDIARVAVESIQKQLAMIDIRVRLVERLPGTPMDDGVDLVYAELAMWEPVVDARRLLDADGMSGGASPYMSLALRRLEQASEWRDVTGALERIHRVAHQDAAILPLWQLVDHFACHESLDVAGERPVSLYQNVEQWQPSFYYPTEEK